MPTTELLSDSRIVANLKQRNPAALADLFDRYGRLVYSLAFRILRDSGDAEDVVQEVFLRVWTRSHLIDSSRDLLAPWLLTVTRNLAIDSFRDTRIRDRIIQQGADDSYGFVSSPIALPIPGNTDLSRALSALHPDQRKVIAFAYFEGLSQREISERLGRPLGTVKTWLRKALRVLRLGMTKGAASRTLPSGREHSRQYGIRPEWL